MMILNRNRFLCLPAILATGLVALVFAGCGEWPQARLDTYFGPQPETGHFTVAELPKGPIHAGLWVLNDTGAPGSAPKLSETAFTDLTEHVRQQLLHAVPIKVRAVHSSDLGALPPEFDTVLRWAKDRQVEYLVMAVLSSSEIEVPERFPWRGLPWGPSRVVCCLGIVRRTWRWPNWRWLTCLPAACWRESRGMPGLPWTGWIRPSSPMSTRWFDGTLKIRPFTLRKKQTRRHASGMPDQAVLHLKEAWGRPWNCAGGLGNFINPRMKILIKKFLKLFDSQSRFAD